MSTPWPSEDWFIYNDGGRSAAGFRGSAGDCVVRAVAIAAQMPYAEAYAYVNAQASVERRGKSRRSNARTGVNTKRKWFRDWMRSLGFTWTPCMSIGTGCRVHLRADELPDGWLIVNVSRHLVAVINGAVHDTHDSSRGGTRCVYGYWRRS